jgi:hypothetical protein
MRRDQLADAARYCGTLLHELTHALSGFPDLTFEFEEALSAQMGVVASAGLGERPGPRTQCSDAQRPQTMIRRGVCAQRHRLSARAGVTRLVSPPLSRPGHSLPVADTAAPVDDFEVRDSTPVRTSHGRVSMFGCEVRGYWCGLRPGILTRTAGHTSIQRATMFAAVARPPTSKAIVGMSR